MTEIVFGLENCKDDWKSDKEEIKKLFCSESKIGPNNYKNSSGTKKSTNGINIWKFPQQISQPFWAYPHLAAGAKHRNGWW